MADDIVESIQGLLSCSVCSELFTEPKTLPCMHTFCEECIRKHIKVKTEKNEDVKCPSCNEPTSEAIVKEIKTNFNYVSMIEKINEKAKSSHCSQCEEGAAESEAVAYCTECDLYLCSHCVHGHKRNRRQSKHEITPLQERTSKPLVLSTDKQCSLHSQTLNLFCVTHEVIICQTCTVTEHRLDCSINFIDKKTVENERNNLLRKLETLRTIYDRLKTDKKNLQDMKDNMKSSHKETKHKILEHSDAMKREIDENAAKRTQELDAWYNKAMKDCTLSYDTAETHCDIASSVNTECQALQSSAQLTVDTLIQTLSLARKIQHLESLPTLQMSQTGNCEYKIADGKGYLTKDTPTEQPELHVTTPTPTQNEPIQVIIASDNTCIARVDGASVEVRRCEEGHSIQWTPTTHANQHLEVEVLEHKVKQSIDIPLIRNYNPLTPDPTELSLTTPPLGVCLLKGQNQLAVTTNAKKIKLIDTATFTETKEIDGNFVRPYFMCSTSDSLWVTDREAHNVKRIRLEDNTVDLQYGTKGAGFCQLSHPRGVAMSPDNHELIYVADMKNNRIVVLQVQGTVATELCTIGRDILNQPAGIAFNRRGELAVCDDRNCRVVLFSATGLHIQDMGVARNGTGLLCSPIGITVDDHDRYIVGEFGSHCTTTLGREGNILSCTRSVGGAIGEFTYPRGVAVDHKGLIYVADHGNKRIVRL